MAFVEGTIVHCKTLLVISSTRASAAIIIIILRIRIINHMNNFSFHHNEDEQGLPYWVIHGGWEHGVRALLFNMSSMPSSNALVIFAINQGAICPDKIASDCSGSGSVNSINLSQVMKHYSRARRALLLSCETSVLPSAKRTMSLQMQALFQRHGGWLLQLDKNKILYQGLHRGPERFVAR